MQLFMPVKPSDLIEKIAILRTSDPNHPQLVALQEREHDLFRSQPLDGITSDSFRHFLDKLTVLKTRLQAEYISWRDAKHSLYNRAMEPKVTPDDFRQAILGYKNAEQALLSTKTEIDALVNSPILPVIGPIVP